MDASPPTRPSTGKRLSDEQRAVVDAPLDAAIRVLASAGAGKTTVITRRYERLVMGGMKPAQIVAVTFTDSMATELRTRLERIVPELRRSVVGRRQVATIHSLCWTLLRESGDKRLHAVETWQINRMLGNILEDEWPNARSRPSAKLVGEWIGWLKEHNLRGEAAARKMMANKLPDAVARATVNVMDRMGKIMDENHQLSFADMLADTEERLNSDQAFKARWQDAIQVVILDEAQDTSSQAMRILATLAAPQNRMMVVGDADQMLFRFAGATPEFNLYAGFEDFFPDAMTFHLGTNYRSTRAIVEAGKRVIQYNYEAHGGSTSARYMKDIRPRPDAPEGEPVDYRLYQTRGQEAEAVCEEIVNLAKAGRAGDVFVGARTRAQLATIEQMLTLRDVPTMNLCGGSFWSLPHIRAIVDHLALALNRGDRVAFKTVAPIPSKRIEARRLGPAFVEACGGSLLGMTKAMQSPEAWRWRVGSEDLMWVVGALEDAIAAHERPAQLIKRVLDLGYRRFIDTGGVASANSRDLSEDKTAEIKALITFADEYDTVQELVDHARTMQRLSEEKNEKGRVVLATIHKLKGMERPIVFGIGWCEDAFERKPGDIQPVGFLPHSYALQSHQQQQIEDERCLAFVLISRAQEVCRLSGFYLSEDNRPLRASRFAVEAEVWDGRGAIVAQPSVPDSNKSTS